MCGYIYMCVCVCCGLHYQVGLSEHTLRDIAAVMSSHVETNLRGYVFEIVRDKYDIVIQCFYVPLYVERSSQM